MSIENTQAVMKVYYDGDLSAVHEEATYKMMGTGEQVIGREAIGEMIASFYTVPFNGRFLTVNKTYSENQAVVEGELHGEHIGEFAGVPATGRKVKVPMVIIYDLDDELIVGARIYFLTDVFLRQVGEAS